MHKMCVKNRTRGQITEYSIEQKQYYNAFIIYEECDEEDVKQLPDTTKTEEDRNHMTSITTTTTGYNY